ncbi:MAG: hypothetical protein PVH54_04670 [Gammaproteobacteria bacterium]|jgi:hypothetical protein
MDLKSITCTAAALSITALVTSPVLAGSMPSGKSGIASGDLAIVEASAAVALAEAAPEPLLTTYIKVPQDKELIFDLSAECGLYTRTLAKSKGGNKDTASAEASVLMNVTYTNVDTGVQEYAYPGGAGDGVVFCSRAQELSATFQGIFQTGEEYDALIVTADNNDDGDINSIVDTCDAGGLVGDIYYDADVCEPITVVGTCLYQHADNNNILLDVDCLQEEEVELVLDTMSANSFNFVGPNLKQGVYRIDVWADVDTCTGDKIGSCINGDDPDVEAKATIGRASLVVDEVRFIQDESGW